MCSCRQLQFVAKVEDEMAMNDSDRAWVQLQISNSLASHGFKGWLKSWGPLLVPAVGVAALFLFALTQWGDYKEFRGSTNSRLTDIENHLDRINGELRPLQAKVQLDPISSSIQLAKSTKATPAQIQQIASKLSPIQDDFADVPAVWQTTAEFINYKYEALIPDSHQIRNLALNVNCTHRGELEFLNGVATFKNCELTLDNHLVGGAREIRFINCIIRYSGGPVPESAMSFERCLFQFNVPIVPPRRGQKTMQILADSATTEKSIQVPA